MGKNKIKLDRNNTNFSLQLLEHFRNTKWETKYDFLKYYQNLVRSYMADINIDARGVLVKHMMGLGKSILAVAVAIDCIENDRRQPIVMMTKSLKGNMVRSIYKYVDLRRRYDPDYFLCKMDEIALSEWIEKNFSFVSMNASNMLKQLSDASRGTASEELERVVESRMGEVLKMQSLDGKLLIVDEAHNIFRAITNGSKNGLGLYNRVMSSKNLKIVFLTGTPISNDPFELVPCFNMLGSMHPGKLTFPEDYREFRKLYVDDEHKTIKNKAKFQNRIMGLVSSVSHKSKPGFLFGVDSSVGKAEFPEQLPIVLEKCPMEATQYVAYQLARDKEKDEGKNAREAAPQSMVIPKSKSASSYRVRSRQLSNNYKGISPKLDKLMINIDKHKSTLGLVYSQFTGEGGTGPFAKRLLDAGWKEYTASDYKGSIMPSAEKSTDEVTISNPNAMFDIMPLIETEPDEKTGSYDEYDPLASIFNRSEGRSSGWWGGAQLKGDGTRRFALITGDVDPDDRIIIQDVYNLPENAHGEIIELLIVSSAAAEGLDFKNIRHVHVLEPYWTWGRIMQIISRGVRNDSHIGLPPEEKNVQPYIYLAIPPTSEIAPDGTYPPTTDTELYEESLADETINWSFISSIDEVSLECEINAESHCRKCSPNNKPLFTDDPSRDCQLEDPCTLVETGTVTAKEIEIDGKKYQYIDNEKSAFGITVYEYNDKIAMYERVQESDAAFMRVYEALNGDVLGF